MRAELEAVRDALGLASHVLTAEPAELGSQLVGRLVENEEPGLVRLRAGVARRATVWPLLPSLTTPGGPLLGTVPARSDVPGDPVGGRAVVAVHAITVTPDGRTAIVGYEDGEVRCVDVETRVAQWGCGLDSDILSLAATPRGGLVVVGSADGTVRVLDAALGENVAVLGRHGGAVHKVAASPDGRLAVSRSFDGDLRVWDLESRDEAARLTVPGPFALSPDGRRLYGATDAALRRWDLASLASDDLGHIDSSHVLAMAVTPDGRALASISHETGGAPGRVLNRIVLTIHDLDGENAPSRGTCTEPPAGLYHPDWADLAVASDGDLAVSGLLGTGALCWDLRRLDHPAVLAGHSGQVLAVAVTPNAQRIITGSRDGTVRVWDPARAAVAPHIAAHPGEANGVAATASGRRAVTVASDGSIAVWDLGPQRGGRALPWTGEPCWSVGISPDGARAVIGAAGGVVAVLDLASGAPISRHTHPGGDVWQVGFSVDGRELWAVAIDGTLLCWDSRTGTARAAPVQTGGVPPTGVAVTPDGHRALAGRADGTVVTGRLDRSATSDVLGRHDAGVRSAALTPDGRAGVTGAADRGVVVWDLERLTARHVVAAHDGVVSAVALTPDGRLAVSAGADGRLAFWDVATGARLASFTAEGRLISVALASNGSLCMAGEQSGRIHALLLNLKVTEPAVKAPGPRMAAARPAVARDLAGARAAAAQAERRLAGDPGNDELAEALGVAYADLGACLGAAGAAAWLGYAIRARDLLRGLQASGAQVAADALERLDEVESAVARMSVSVGSEFARLPIEPESLHGGGPCGPVLAHGRARGPVLAVATVPREPLAVSAGADGTLWVWDVAHGVGVRPLRGHDGAVLGVAVAPDGGVVASGSGDATVRLWNLSAGRNRATLRAHEDAVFAVAVTPDGRHVVSGSGDRTVRVWDIATGAPVRTWQGHTGRVMAVAVSADGRMVASGSEDGTLRLWDPTTGDCRVLTGHEAAVLAVAFTPDGSRVVSGSFDQTIKVWDPARGEPTATLGGHYDAIRAVVAAPDGRRLVSACFDGSIRIWDLAWKAEIATLTGHSKAVTSIALCADPHRLVSGSEDGTVRVWDLLVRGDAHTAPRVPPDHGPVRPRRRWWRR